MTHAEEISAIMKSAGVNSIDFVFSYNKPRIQREGITYEIFSIFAPDDGDTELALAARPTYNWRLVDLHMDESWRESSWRKIRGLVEREISKRAAW